MGSGEAVSLYRYALARQYKEMFQEMDSAEAVSLYRYALARQYKEIFQEIGSGEAVSFYRYALAGQWKEIFQEIGSGEAVSFYRYALAGQWKEIFQEMGSGETVSFYRYALARRYKEILMQMELPDIVFSHSYEDRGWNPHYYYKCIIDKNGNVYYTENPDAAYAISHSEGEATFDENWTIIHHVDEIELREQYCIFLELAWILFGKWKEGSVSILCLP